MTQINDVYTNKEVIEQMEQFFNENGFLQLTSFLEKEPIEFKKALESEQLTNIFEPTFQKKQTLNLKSTFKFEILQLIEYFKSKEFIEYIESITEFELHLNNIELNIYKHKDFIILNDKKTDTSETLDVIFDLTEKWNEHAGGTLTYTTKEEEVFYLEPLSNTITLIYNPKEVMKYLKYINNKAKNNKIIRIEMSFSIDE